MKTLLIIAIVYFAIKFLSRLLAPFLIKKMAAKMQQRANEQFGGKRPEPSVNEGETVIDKKPQQSNQGSKKVGEYVDFEEID